MGKWLMIIIGGILAVLGLIGLIGFWGSIWPVILAFIVLAVLLIGVAMVIFGIGELGAESPAKAPPQAEQSQETKPPAEQ